MSIFKDKVELNGRNYKRITMIEGIKLQSGLMKCITKSKFSLKDLQFEENSNDISKIINLIISIISENTDFIIEVLEMFYDGNISELEAGTEYDILFDLVEHTDIKRIISQLKTRVGKMIPQE